MRTEIPTIDLGTLRSGLTCEREARSLREAAAVLGAFQVVGHGVSRATVEQAFLWACRFFNQPMTVKESVHHRRTGGHRGYVPPGTEATDPADGGDRKEAFDLGLELPPLARNARWARRAASPNLWPVQVPGMRRPLELYMQAMRDLGERVFDALGLALHLDRGTFADLFARPIGQMRLLRYPPDIRRGGAPGIGAHCDYEALSIIAQAQALPGLELQTSDGKWIRTAPTPGTFLVLVGEMLQRWSNDIFRAVPHRVGASARERLSIVFFFGPDYETVLRPLPGCSGPQRPPRYAPVTAGAYLARRLTEIYEQI